MLATAAANVVFWAWSAAPPRFSVPGLTDILAARGILGAAHPRNAASLVNLYAARPSLHVAWTAWCAAAGPGMRAPAGPASCWPADADRYGPEMAGWLWMAADRLEALTLTGPPAAARLRSSSTG